MPDALASFLIAGISGPRTRGLRRPSRLPGLSNATYRGYWPTSVTGSPTPLPKASTRRSRAWKPTPAAFGTSETTGSPFFFIAERSASTHTEPGRAKNQEAPTGVRNPKPKPASFVNGRVSGGPLQMGSVQSKDKSRHATSPRKPGLQSHRNKNGLRTEKRSKASTGENNSCRTRALLGAPDEKPARPNRTRSSLLDRRAPRFLRTLTV